ncbi:SCO family protein [Armatimonas rosea]|uniref:Protein SCO1/2 n=1 Tax=Armatimonas rosea TaxID=685828 RepID=A0A7W9W7C3_ARMRO|nr:SCO family protein [Armatimonas rosea]MBB6051076.1 protein SCO1/2 [Armatimonas rosea]
MFRRGLLALVMALGVLAPSAFAQGQSQQAPAGSRPRFDTGINAARDVAINQNLDAELPLEAQFHDELGRTVALKEYFGKKPVWMVLPFFKCTGTCPMMVDGMISVMHEPSLGYQIGRDFEIVVISINPRETPEIAAAKKQEYLSKLGLAGAEKSFHFLTGDEKDIRAVADALGYKYVYDARTDQYAHASATFVATPKGKISRYHFGVSYSPKDVRLSLTEAGQGRIGSLAEKVLLFCYHYDPQRNTYGLAAFRLTQVLGVVTILALGSFMIINFRREAREQQLTRTSGGDVVNKTSDREA